jgi:hypothetical protein
VKTFSAVPVGLLLQAVGSFLPVPPLLRVPLLLRVLRLLPLPGQRPRPQPRPPRYLPPPAAEARKSPHATREARLLHNPPELPG